jgi:hypothetical protein
MLKFFHQLKPANNPRCRKPWPSTYAMACHGYQ